MDFLQAQQWLAKQVHLGGDTHIQVCLDLASRLQNLGITQKEWLAPELLKQWGVKRYLKRKDRPLEDIKADFRQALVKKVATIIARREGEAPQPRISEPSSSSAPPPAAKRCANDEFPSEDSAKTRRVEDTPKNEASSSSSTLLPVGSSGVFPPTASEAATSRADRGASQNEPPAKKQKNERRVVLHRCMREEVNGKAGKIIGKVNNRLRVQLDDGDEVRALPSQVIDTPEGQSTSLLLQDAFDDNPMENPSAKDEAHGTNSSFSKLDQLIELTECETWLQTEPAAQALGSRLPEALRVTTILKSLTPTEKELKSAASFLSRRFSKVSHVQMQESFTKDFLERYRIWRKGGMFVRSSATSAFPEISLADAVVPLQARSIANMWWLLDLRNASQIVRKLRTSHPKAMSEKDWKTLIARLTCLLKRTTRKQVRSIPRLKDENLQAQTWLKAAEVFKNNPKLAKRANGEESKEMDHDWHNAIHYDLSKHVVHQILRLQQHCASLDMRLERSTDEMPSPAQAGNDQAALPTSPGNIDDASESNVLPLADEDQAKASTTAKQTTSVREFVKRYLEHPCIVPFDSVYEKWPKLLRHLACLELGNVDYCQLPLSDEHVLEHIGTNHDQRSRTCETEEDLIVEAKACLRKFLSNVRYYCANQRLVPGLHLLERHHRFIKGDTLVDQLVDFFASDAIPENARTSWLRLHPYRLATLSVYFHVLVTPNENKGSQWHAYIKPAEEYIPADQISSMPVLASQCQPSHVRPSDADEPICEECVTEQPGQAVATPPVVCELCHKFFMGRDSLKRHTEKEHGNWHEYRKRAFWMAQKTGLLPLLAWVKRSILQTIAFFQCFSVPGSFNDWTERTHRDYSAFIK